METSWNERYKSEDYVYGTEPNVFFKQQINALKPGTILLPAEGEGRNAVYAAKLGWKVTCFDFSTQARLKALKLAELNSVEIHYINCTYEDFAPEYKYDAIAFIYAHMEPALRKNTHSRFIEYLNENGIILLEAFNKCQLKLESGGPKNSDMLYDIKILSEDFNELFIDFLNEEKIHLSEGYFHRGEAEIIQMIARKRH